MRKIVVLASLLIGLFSLNPLSVNAEEKFSINQENQTLINEAVNREVSNEDYIEGVIEVYYAASNENDSEINFNEYLKDSLLELAKYDKEQDEEIQYIVEENKAMVEEPSIDSISPQNNISPSAIIIDPTLPAYNTALAAYKAGIAVVDRVGHWQTANYMRHAIAPAEKRFTDWTPSTYYNRNDTWANMVDGEELIIQYFTRLKNEAFIGGKTSGSFSGSYSFKSGHLMTALRGVSYTITYRLQENGNYYTQTKVTDRFDFKWETNGYDAHFGAGFGNNYAYLMQQAGFIRPFKIEIVNDVTRL